MTFTTGELKIINIGGIGSSVISNSLEIILRESGRFIVTGDEEFIAKSEKKTRTITISGTIGAGSSAEHFHEYDANPAVNQFETADLFPQDLINKYNVDELEIYGVVSLCNMSLETEPGDAIARLLGSHFKYWISRQPQTSWNPEDSIGVIFSAYQTLPTKGLEEVTEGVIKNTVKKNLLPIFSPIKSSFSVRKDTDIIYLYNLAHILGHCAASTGGGAISGSCSLEQRLIIGMGFLPEEVEELLSPSQ